MTKSNGVQAGFVPARTRGSRKPRSFRQRRVFGTAGGTPPVRRHFVASATCMRMRCTRPHPAGPMRGTLASLAQGSGVIPSQNNRGTAGVGRCGVISSVSSGSRDRSAAQQHICCCDYAWPPRRGDLSRRRQLFAFPGYNLSFEFPPAERRKARSARPTQPASIGTRLTNENVSWSPGSSSKNSIAPD